MWDGFESRKFPRAKADCKIFIEEITEGKPALASTTENIGVGGICVVLDKPLTKFSKVKVQVDLADGEAPIQCEARVVWRVESRDLLTERTSHDTGIEFLDLSADSRERLKRLISSKSNPS